MKVNKADVILDYKGGYYNQTEIAEIHGVTRQRISQILIDCVPNKQRISESATNTKAILRARESGGTYTQIAASLGLTRGQVAGVVYRNKRVS